MRILCFVAYYLPGYQAGGPLRTIANFVDHLGDEFDIRIVTRDRDVLDTKPYADVVIDGWNTLGKAQVFYASAKTLNLGGVASLLRHTDHDILYLNSFFAFSFTTLPLLARRLGMAPRKPCVIAPRGEFSSGAIALKAWKKRQYLSVVKSLGLYKDLHWQASSEFERQDIVREFGVNPNCVFIAPDLPPLTPGLDQNPLTRKPGSLRIVFLSRITPKKNLDYLLRVLGWVQVDVELAIYGTLENPNYWEQCCAAMGELPSNINARYIGAVSPVDVLPTFAAYDLFVFPTRGENYGHVVLEALMAGTPVLISDQTPWGSSEDGAVEILPLAEQHQWAIAITRWASFDDGELYRRRQAAYLYAQNYLDSSEVIQQNRQLFLDAMPR